jgi:D-alanyl-D-alanine carboxypeptidase
VVAPVIVASVAAAGLLVAVGGPLASPAARLDGNEAVAAASVAPAAASVAPAAASAAPGASVAPSAAPAAARPSPAPAPSPAPHLPGRPAVLPAQTVRISDAALDAALGRWLKATGTPGISAAIVWPGGRVWTGAIGTADAASDVPMTPDTALSFASVTKTFTAALVLQLVDEGTLELDTLVAPILPEAKLDPRMTVRHLLDHTSGLPDMFRMAGIEPALHADIHKRWTVEDSLRFGVKDRVKPDTFWRYSNTGYVYLGELLERVTGKPWAALVRERLLDPLALGGTFVQGAEDPRGPLARGHRVSKTASGFRIVPLGGTDPLTPFASVVTAAGAAGAIAGTAEDVARWAYALYGGGVLDAGTLEQAVVDAQRVDRFKPRTRYGLGVQLVQLGEHETWGHSGTFLGFKNQVRWLPEARIAVVVLTNQSRVDVGVLEKELIGLALSSSPAPSCPACL